MSSSQYEYILTTKRCKLRKANVNSLIDQEFIRQIWNDPTVVANIGQRNITTLDQSIECIEKMNISYDTYGFGSWLIEYYPEIINTNSTTTIINNNNDTITSSSIEQIPTSIDIPNDINQHQDNIQLNNETRFQSQPILIGLAGLLKRDVLPCPDIGWCLFEQYQQKGLGSELTMGILQWYENEYPIELKKKVTQINNLNDNDENNHNNTYSLCGIVKPSNVGSRKLFEKFGFQYIKIISLPWTNDECCYYERTF